LRPIEKGKYNRADIMTKLDLEERRGVSGRIVKYLEENNVTFEQVTHSSAGSAEEYKQTMGTRLEQQAKALFVRVKNKNSKGFVIVAIQAQKKADFDLVRRLSGAAEVRLGNAEQLKEATGCSYGELPPLGKIFSLPLMMDRELLTEEKIYFNAGALNFSIIMNPVELVRIEEPVLF
jgi:Ala-tRNA(Pro) deacylase